MQATDTQPTAPGSATPQAEHQWLQKLVGQWTYQGEASMGPDQPAEKFEGVERVRPMGDLWVVAEGQGDMPCMGPMSTMLTLGFDPARGKFVGTWLASAMTMMWVYEGELDEQQRKLSLYATGPDCRGSGRIIPYRDSIEIVSPDHRIFRGQFQAEDGTWQQMMEAHYRRQR